MKLTSQPSAILPRVLLDKGIVRRFYEAQVRRGRGILPTSHQMDAVQVFVQLLASDHQLFITAESFNVLQLRQPKYASGILDNTKILRKGRYLRRWARRLRDYVFTREDAVILAYASFGVDPDSRGLGAGAIVTGDLKMVTNFNTQQAEIKERFDRMAENLPEPYRSASLPEVVTPAIALSEWQK